MLLVSSAIAVDTFRHLLLGEYEQDMNQSYGVSPGFELGFRYKRAHTYGLVLYTPRSRELRVVQSER
jgi:hypothetical protein